MYFEEVENDVKEAKSWYKLKQKGLEKIFAETIENAIIKLQSSPKAYAIRYKNIRISYPKTFPYAIHFYINELQNSIVITAIAFVGREPGYTQQRI